MQTTAKQTCSISAHTPEFSAFQANFTFFISSITQGSRLKLLQNLIIQTILLQDGK